ncbi:hypothetical protein A2U01_0090743, partial [Trifolium medium]|nr:hypothetical protein [Trifolium medium]
MGLGLGLGLGLGCSGAFDGNGFEGWVGAKGD